MSSGAPMSPRSQAALSPKTLRILLVDDDAEVLTSLAIVLRRDGHVVVCPPSGGLGQRVADRVERGHGYTATGALRVG